MLSDTMIQISNKAMISLDALCGLRVFELRTVKMKNLIWEDGGWFIYANPKDMNVKNSTPRRSPLLLKLLVLNISTLTTFGILERDLLQNNHLNILMQQDKL